MMMKLTLYFHFYITFLIITLRMFYKSTKDFKNNLDRKKLKLSTANTCFTKLLKQPNKNKISIRKIKHQQIH